MDLPLFWIDAFTDRTFGGNPAAVVPLETWPEDGLLQRIANENGVSETSFYVKTGPARAALRWFTPMVEMDLCGHATLAAAYVLSAELGQKEWPFIFDSRSGPLVVSRRGALFEMDFPSRPPKAAGAPAELLRGLGRAPAEVHRSERMWLCVYPSADDVMAITPDQTALALTKPGRVIVTAPGKDCDFVSRFFAPEVGVPEDPATGSAHCTLVPYWAARLGRAKLHARQVSRRGGELWCELDGDRVRMAGNAAPYLKGRITV